MKLNAINVGDEPLKFTAALHSCFSMSDDEAVSISELETLQFWDNDGSEFSARKPFADTVLTLSGPLNHVYFDSTVVRIDDTLSREGLKMLSSEIRVLRQRGHSPI